jgi:hypothetical protein
MIVSAFLGAYAPPTFTKRLPSGETVGVEAVGSSKQGHFWLPNGGPLPMRAPFRKYAELLSNLGSSTPDPRFRWLLLSIDGAPSQPSVVARFAKGAVRQVSVLWNPTGTRTWLGGFDGNHREAEATVSVGVADQPWKPIGSVKRLSGGKIARYGTGFFLTARPWIDPKMPKGKTDEVIVDAALPTDDANHAYEVSLFNAKGDRIHWLMAKASSSTTPQASRQYYFQVKYADVSRVELRARPYQWTSISHVRLNPK